MWILLLRTRPFDDGLYLVLILPLWVPLVEGEEVEVDVDCDGVVDP